MVSKAVNKGQLRGVKMAIDCPTISHLLFADDSLVFFLEATKHYGEKMMEILQLTVMHQGSVLI